MRAKEFLIEAKLTPAELFGKHLNWRPAALLQKLKDRTPFVDSLTPEKAKEYIPAEGEYERLKPMIDAAVAARTDNPNAPVPSLSINIEGGGSIPLSKLEKADLQTKGGQASSKVNVQPIGIGIAAPKVAKGVAASDEIKNALANKSEIVGKNLHQTIIKNEVLNQAGDLGKAIIQASVDIHNGQNPIVKQYDEKIRKTIAIDAGEYLGIQQMVEGTANWSGDKYNKFLEFLNSSDLSNLAVIYPGSQNSQLSDSYGIQNSQTGHTIMISSKGGLGKTAGGAAPALSGLELPPDMLKNIKPGSGVDFIKLMQEQSTINQPFAGLNFLHRYYPDAVPELYKDLLPFTQADIAEINANIKGQSKLGPKYKAIIKSRDVKSRATAGGIVMYAAAKDLVETMNTNQPIPDFKQTVLSILDMNFVQIFSRVVGGKLMADVLWPGKVDGNVYLWTKAEAAAPSSAGLSFKVID
jgi:hypothetical protein